MRALTASKAPGRGPPKVAQVTSVSHSVVLLEPLDRIDGDLDMEDDNQDRRETLDDAPISGAIAYGGDRRSLHAGDPDDAEDDADEWSGIIVLDQNGRWHRA
jgi:hypothetical protein